MLVGHGDDWYNYATPLQANFSSNVWYGISHEDLYENLSTCFSSITQYPHPRAQELQTVLAQRDGCNERGVVVTNGAIEAIYLIAQLLQQSRTAIVIPSFSEYEDACRIFGHLCTYFTIDQLDTIAEQEFGSIWLCNPNNPTGAMLDATTLQDLIKKHPLTHWVIDEVYQEFLIAPQSLVSLCADHENVFVIKSLTKRFCMPGLRLGYIITSPHNADALFAIKQPWSVNALAVAAGIYFCHNQESFPLPIAQWLDNTAALQNALRNINGISVCESQTPFFLVQFQHHSAAYVKHYLATEWKILIRDASSFHGLSANHIRLCTQHTAANDLLIKALNQLV